MSNVLLVSNKNEISRFVVSKHFSVGAAIFALVLGSSILPSLAMAVGCETMNNAELAMKIAKGHAFYEHKSDFKRNPSPGGFPQSTINNTTEFADFLEKIIKFSQTKKVKKDGTRLFWDVETKTIVVINHNNQDCGTAFRPRDGMRYYEEQE